MEGRRAAKGGRQPAWLRIDSPYLSSHPSSAERSARLRQSNR
jgi:hypothetical protein